MRAFLTIIMLATVSACFHNNGTVVPDNTGEPLSVEIGSDTSVKIGDRFIREGTIQPMLEGELQWIGSVNYGDGSGFNSFAVTSEQIFTLSHRFETRGTYTVSVNVLNSLGNKVTDSLKVTVIDLETEKTPPDVAITTPVFGAILYGGSTISISAFDASGIKSVEVFVDSISVGSRTSVPFDFNWNTFDYDNGEYTLTAIAIDNADNFATSEPVTVTVFNDDSTPPQVSITSPNPNEEVSGTKLIEVDALDESGIKSVEVFVGSISLGLQTSAPFEFFWNTLPYNNGDYSLRAIAIDMAYNSTATDPFTVTVNNVKQPEPLVAFPGAYGFGASTTGGRGGDVYYVSSLIDDGDEVGTLRHGIESANGPRTIVFSTGGVINLEDELIIEEKSHLTIAGQTAPGGGITISGYRSEIVDSSNIILRYLTFRVGDVNALKENFDAKNADAISIFLSDHVIFDHLSGSWSIDETLSVSHSNFVTVQHCMIVESLNDSFAPEGNHGFGSLIKGFVDEDNPGGYTFYGNLWAHHFRRMPAIGSVPDGKHAEIDLVNNVIYGWVTRAGHASSTTTCDMNYIGNYVIANKETEKHIDEAMGGNSSSAWNIFHKGNFIDSDQDFTHDGTLATDDAFPGFEGDELKIVPYDFYSALSVPPDPPLPPPPILSAQLAYVRVLASVGNSRVRDSIDQRILDQVATGKGTTIDSQSEPAVGGIVPIAAGTAPPDGDKDGMPDQWEMDNGLNPLDPNDRNGTNLSPVGYTNLEVYLNSLVAEVGP